MEPTDPVEQLYARAARHGITMSDICARAKVAATTPSRWKHERTAPNWGTLQKLSTALNELIAERKEAA